MESLDAVPAESARGCTVATVSAWQRCATPAGTGRGQKRVGARLRLQS